MAGIAALQEAIGYRFQRVGLLREALTHPSLGGKNNQRLEFLGDAVLELCVSEKIYALHPDMQEGALTQLRQKLVREETLAQAARSVRLGDALLMERNFAADGGRGHDSVLCDAFEAVLAAVYLDGGLEAARDVVMRLLGDCRETGEDDAKSALQAYLQARGREMPAYETVGQEGPPHDRVFTAAVLIDGAEAARGTGKTKKRAEQEAAGKALEELRRAGD